MTSAHARAGSKVLPALIAALVAIETVGLVLALRPPEQGPGGDGARACVEERERARALAEQVHSLRTRVSDAERRLAVGAGTELMRAAQLVAQTATPTQTAPSAADETLARVAEAQARETPDPAWTAAAETRLGDLGRALGSAASIERVTCTGTLCRVELAHGVGALPAESIERFLAGAEDLLAQAMVHPDPSGSKTTLVFARAGNVLPNAGGGG